MAEIARRSELTPQARAAKATYLLTIRQVVSTAEFIEALEMQTGEGVRYLLDNLSLGGVPVYQPRRGLWSLLREDDFQEV